MSYILDALKKAEAERTLGSVPNLYTGSTTQIGESGRNRNWRSWSPWIIAALMLLGMLATIATLRPWQSRMEPSPPAPTAPQPRIETNGASANVAAAVRFEAQDAKIGEEAGHQQKSPPPAASNTKKAPLTGSISTEKPAALPASDTNAAPRHAQKNDVEEEKQVGTALDLPPNIQRELPTVVVNGYIYAKNPTDRSVLVDKRLLREGDQVAPDLKLEKLLPKSAILNFKGYRYSVSY